MTEEVNTSYEQLKTDIYYQVLSPEQILELSELIESRKRLSRGENLLDQKQVKIICDNANDCSQIIEKQNKLIEFISHRAKYMNQQDLDEAKQAFDALLFNNQLFQEKTLLIHQIVSQG